jgi:predicted transcriptional regulator
MSEQDNQELQQLRREVSTVSTLVDRFDIAIVKLSEISDNMNKILAVHEIRIEHQQREMDMFSKKFDEHRDDHRRESELIHDRISNKESEVKKDFTTAISNLQKHLDKIDYRLECIEKWKWYAAGVTATALLILVQSGVISKLF